MIPLSPAVLGSSARFKKETKRVRKPSAKETLLIFSFLSDSTVDCCSVVSIDSSVEIEVDRAKSLGLLGLLKSEKNGSTSVTGETRTSSNHESRR